MKYVIALSLLSMSTMAYAELSSISLVNTTCPVLNGQTIRVSSNLTLPKACLLKDTYFLFESVQNVSLNLNGATLQSSSLNDAIRFSTTNPKKPTRNILVKNGIIKGYGTAVWVNRALSATELKNLRDNPKVYYPAIQKTATQNIIIDNLYFDNPQGTAVFVGVANSQVTIKNSNIIGARGPAIYLDTGSYNNIINNNTITQSGFLHPNGSPRFGRGQREAIAVDGSYNNKITSNYLSDNAGGGVHLYSNCGEKVSSDPNYVPRIFDAEKNTISANVISANGLAGAVEIGKRVDWNLESWDCAKPVFAKMLSLKFYWDNSGYNTVQDNTGDGTIYVRTDNNKVINNTMRVEVNSLVRNLKNRPLVGNVVK
ncbi:right-handed parallel beta-helix repeat-containing protein [Thiolinea disciformis]|uniref:right-handed parallel beta-helix repeat-containing protein n=1 Tax=Thiolinea disciformis TaxID=125614 RepID=UPI00037406B2|nr:right-handed parallel beta-helix repeat-containing protein [Thiolinea disciformis]